VAGGAVLGTYVTVALTHLLRQAPPNRPWRHTLVLAGAHKLRADVVERLISACEFTRTGLVLIYSSIPPPVRERLGRGHAALAVMRLGNADDAKAAAEQIGTEHRFVISQFTETVGASVSDSYGDSYSETVGTADSWSGSWSASETAGQSRGGGHSRADVAPFGARTGSVSRETSTSQAATASESLTRGISENTTWGLSTSRTVGASGSLAWSGQRSREFLVEPYELQQLPPSAVIVSYASPAGRQVLLADANPAILALPAAARGPAHAAPPEPRPPAGPGTGGSAWREPGGPPPNLGPPPEPLDWRVGRRRRPWKPAGG
jgi:hypothetical protein